MFKVAKKNNRSWNYSSYGEGLNIYHSNKKSYYLIYKLRKDFPKQFNIKDFNLKKGKKYESYNKAIDFYFSKYNDITKQRRHQIREKIKLQFPDEFNKKDFKIKKSKYIIDNSYKKSVENYHTLKKIKSYDVRCKIKKVLKEKFPNEFNLIDFGKSYEEEVKIYFSKINRISVQHRYLIRKRLKNKFPFKYKREDFFRK